MASDQPKPATLEEDCARLLRLAETDEGFYVLGLHAFIESWVRREVPSLAAVEDFPGLLRAYSRHLEARGCLREDLGMIDRIIREQAIAARVRQAFGRLDAEEARAATHNFLRFCCLAGIDTPALGELRKGLEAWEERKPVPVRAEDPQRGNGEAVASQGDNRRLLAQTEAWAHDKQRLAELEGESQRIAAQLERQARGGAGESETSLRAELASLAEQKQRLSEQLAGYRDLDLYVDHVSRFSHYTRTRMDYERSVMKLSPEQEEAVQGIRPGFDFLIRGGAGTGKTIALLHALGCIKREREGELALRPAGRILFLTYTTTLVKYDRYIAEILREKDAEQVILTADSYFLGRLRLLGQRRRVDYAVMSRMAERMNTSGFFTAQELAVEIEEFIFGSLVSRQEYVEEKIPRRGMRQPLSAGQRETVWTIRDRMIAEMEQEGVLSKNYSRITLIEHMRSHPKDTRLRDIDIAFVDESQDLSAADLAALKLMTHRGLVMAGDTGQSIYGVGSPYRRAGVDIAGRFRVLHTSFRNTVPIHEVTEAYRKLSGLDDEEATVAFRDGPIPELYTASTPEELARLLLRKAALFIDRLGYDPENLTVLAPTRTDLATIGDLLGHAGYRHANIRDEDFSFKQEKTIRLSTLHSSKGLDFAVVLLYLPSLPLVTEYEERAGETLTRNLLYVAMTRAMDNLNVFTLDGAHDGQREEPLQDLIRVFRRRERA